MARTPITFNFTSTCRDTALTKDSLLTNCYHEKVNEKMMVVKRPALALFSHFKAAGVNITATTQGAITFNGGNFVIANDSYGTVAATTTTLTALSPAPSPANQVFSLCNIPASGSVVAKVFLKSADKAWVWDGTTMTQVTDVDYPAATVPGVIYLDGTIYVMDTFGVIWGSDLNAPASWNALTLISANSEADGPVALSRQLNYVIAFKSWSIQAFYDAGNATGSPLASIPNALNELGCGTASSIATSDNTIFFVCQSKQQGRAVARMDGYVPQIISPEWINRVLNGDSLTGVFSFVVKTGGHFFYVLTLTNTGVTIVYDQMTQEWDVWTGLTANSPASVTSAVAQTDGTILITLAAPATFADGDPVTIAGATPSQVNGTFTLTPLTTSTFTYVPSSTVTGSITGTITATLFTSSFFPAVYYAYALGADMLLDRTNGSIYTLNPSTYQDNGAPVNMKVRTPLIDGGTLGRKFVAQTEAMSDNVSTSINIRYSDDDYQTWSTYETLPIAYDRPMLTCQGSFYRRAYEIRHIDNTPFRIIGLECNITLGT